MSRTSLVDDVEEPLGPGSVPSRLILGMRVDGTSYRHAADQATAWAKSERSGYVCVASVNNVMIARTDPHLLAVMNDADLVTPDGMPLVWGLRRLGVPTASRVRGTDLMRVLLSKAATEGIPVGFLGGTPRVLDLVVSRATSMYPELHVVYETSPPFRPASAEEDEATANDINASGAQILFVGLGCPKQELWMARQRGTVRAVMIGVGAAFDFVAGVKRQAPTLLQRSGFEWFFRFLTEPRRLGRRYWHQNPRFVALFAKQLMDERLRGLKENTFDGRAAG